MSKIFTFFLVTSFLTTAFFCSCAGSVEASLTSNSYHDDADGCDSPQGKNHHPSEKHCDCYVAKVVNADITAKSVLIVPGSISHQSLILNAFFSSKNIDVKHNLIYAHGPPGPIVVVPLYIQFHTLRI